MRLKHHLIVGFIWALIVLGTAFLLDIPINGNLIALLFVASVVDSTLDKIIS